MVVFKRLGKIDRAVKRSIEDDQNRNLSLADLWGRNFHHKIKKKEGPVWKVRRHCKKCYYDNVKILGIQFATNGTSKVTTFCDDCPDKPYLCKWCFYEEHGHF